MQRSPEDGFAGLIDPWAHGRTSQYALPMTVITGGLMTFNLLMDRV
jgi:hypothetical protein